MPVPAAISTSGPSAVPPDARRRTAAGSVPGARAAIARSARRHCLPWPGCATQGRVPHAAREARKTPRCRRRHAPATGTARRDSVAACRPRAQADPVDVAADLFAEAQLAGQLAQRQFTRRQHPVPMQHAVFQRLGEAGEEFAMIAYLAVLAYPPLHQQRRADMAVAVAAALRTVVAEPPGAIEDAFPGSSSRQAPDGCRTIRISRSRGSTRARRCAVSPLRP